MSARPRLLILSFSPLHRDARLLKQINGFADRYDVTTCGFGPSPRPDITHLRVDELKTRASSIVSRCNDALLALRLYGAVYRWTGYVREARALLTGKVFDAVLADDLDAVPLAVELFGSRRVHADLHEHWPTVRGHDAKWKLLRAGYYRWLVRRFASGAASVTTVSQGIAEEYTREFGMPVGVVTNAAPFREAEPLPTQSPLRLVYSGVAAEDRGIESIIQASGRTTIPVVLTLFLVGGSEAYLSSLRTLADDVDAPIVFRDAVPYEQLHDRLREHDLGFYAPPPINVNHSLALPNKVFDFVQARLGLIVGPSAEMARMVTTANLGIVTADFGVQALVDALNTLSPQAVDGYKAASHAVAEHLSAERQQTGWELPIEKILSTDG
ncbi:glycosyltransferase family 1 protein [Microbacterium esteraromaticum]|nr:glycosyltransferase family 1 protein [Microbacterium esteraromaticum]